MARKLNAAKNEPIVSPSLIKPFNPSHPIPTDFRIEWEELMGVPINQAHYTGLSTLELDGERDSMKSAICDESEAFLQLCEVKNPVMSSDKSSSMLLASVYDYVDPELDALLLEASQQFERKITTQEDSLKSDKENNNPTMNRFGQPQNKNDIK